MRRLISIAGAAVTLLSLVPGIATAQASTAPTAESFPSKPIRIIVPFTPGGSNDVLARVISQKFQATWKQPAIVENKPGAAGNIGAEFVARSPADGHTLLITANNLLCVNPAMYAKMSFDPLKDLQLVAPMGTLPIVLVVHPSLPVKTVSELIAHAKARPDALSYASGGVGGPQHLSAEMFKVLTGTSMLHVPYKGSGPAVADLLAGQVQVMFSPINSVLPLIKTGRVRALGVATPKRSADLPDVPTIAEAAVPGYVSEIWIALATPTGTPKEVVETLNQEVRRTLTDPEVKEKLAAQGIEAMTVSQGELMTMVKNDCTRWPKLIRDLKIRAE